MQHSGDRARCCGCMSWLHPGTCSWLKQIQRPTPDCTFLGFGVLCSLSSMRPLAVHCLPAATCHLGGLWSQELAALDKQRIA